MNIAIIDDSRLAREELRRQVEQNTSHDVIGEAVNADEAEHLVETQNPDLLLLDIQMPGRDGFELLEQLEPVPQVIFVTAYDEYAIKAFEVNALDYLTKPVDSQRLQEALLKAQEQVDTRQDTDHDRKILTEDDRVFVKDGKHCWFVRLGDIELFESKGNYSVLHMDDDKPMIKRSLNYLEKRVDSALFFRTNRSEMINIKKITTIDPWFNQSITVSLANGRQVEISRRRSQEFRDKMSL